MACLDNSLRLSSVKAGTFIIIISPYHPHGGGEGRTSGGRHPVTPWGVPTKGYKTRKNKRTDKLIVRRRSAK